jgi:hypothetical protein
VIVAAMRKHVDSAGLCHQGCCALQNLAASSDTQLDASVSNGVINVVVVAMERHSDIAECVPEHCRIWRGEVMRMLRPFVAEGVSNVVMAAMRTHGDDE